MNRKRNLKALFICIVTLWTFLALYKSYLYLFERDYSDLNAVNLDRIEALLKDKGTFSFAVVGNVKNSMNIFSRRIAPLLREGEVDFVISAGNAVYDGAEDKYRILSRGFNRLGLPYILAVGMNEVEDFGTERFYRHFGPLFFSFDTGGAYFIFLDSTGETSWNWQMRYLEKELKHSEDFKARFVILNHSLFKPSDGFEDAPVFVLGEERSRVLQDIFSRYGVTAVFSSGFTAYERRSSKGVEYFTSGCGGGLLLDEKKENYQFLRVDVGRDGVTFKNVQVPHKTSSLMYKLKTLELFLHSFFYISFFNFLLILGLIGLVAVKVYSQIVRQETYYRDFSVDEKAISGKQLRVAIFTDNYLPFIGGVPISIHRLYRSLIQAGSTVKIFAPSYEKAVTEEESDIFRCPTFFSGKESKFQITNIFSRAIGEAFTDFGPDLVHVNHPFWLSDRGRKLGKRHGVPVIFTYHTRLERYMHYVPIPGSALKSLLAHFLIKRFANRCDAIIAPTSSTEEYLRRLGVSSMIETIPTGIDIQEYEHWSSDQIREFRTRYASEDEHLLICVCRMAVEKNLDFLIDALVKVRERTRVPFRCLLVGNGPERIRLEEKVARIGMSSHILFIGSMEPQEVARAYLAADLYVFASTSETQGMVLLEAMAGGCPVVAVNSSGVYDVVEDGFNGFKVSESTESWSEAVILLLENRELLDTLTLNSRVFADKYSEEKISGRILKLYRRVLLLKGADSRPDIKRHGKRA